MRALTYDQSGALLLTECPDPLLTPTGVLVRVVASGLNRADLLQRAGHYPAPPGWPANILGLEYAGTVAAVGPSVSRWKVGQPVMGLVGSGAHAEYLVVDQREIMPVPVGLPFSEAAGIPEAFLTAWDALVLRGRLIAGERVLIHSAGSGVGTAATQLAHHLGAVTIGTSRTPEKLAQADRLGLQLGVLTTDPHWPEAVGGKVDLIIDTLGADAFQQNVSLLANRGRMVLLGMLTGSAVSLDLAALLSGRLEIIGTVMRTRLLAERDALVERFTRDVLPAFADETLRPIVDQLVPMDEAEDAFRMMQANEVFGKIVLVW